LRPSRIQKISNRNELDQVIRNIKFGIAVETLSEKKEVVYTDIDQATARFEIPSEKALGSWESQLPKRFLGNWEAGKSNLGSVNIPTN